MSPPEGAHERAVRLRGLHRGPEPLMLVNVWDVASALTVEAQGAPALATASWGVAAAYGADDDESMGRDAMLAAVARIAGAVFAPLSADLQRGFGETPGDVGETMALAIEAGAVGCNLEDGVGPAHEPRPLDDAVARIAATVAAGQRAGVPLVINARTDVFLHATDHGEAQLAEAVDRGRAFLEAGADCVFLPGLTDRALIARAVEQIGPVSVLATPASPPLHELAELGVVRISVGPGAMGVAYAALAATARTLLGGGELPADLGFRPPG